MAYSLALAEDINVDAMMIGLLNVHVACSRATTIRRIIDVSAANAGELKIRCRDTQLTVGVDI